MQRLKVFLLVCSGFVFFRSGDTYQAVKMLYRMVLPFEGGIFTGFSSLIDAVKTFSNNPIISPCFL